MQPLVTILIPHFRTLPLTKVCLQLLQQHTDLSKVGVIVIDNDSQDDSKVYLNRLSWLTYLERKRKPNETPIQSHACALDLGLSFVSTPYVLSIHTDTLMIHYGWLSFLLKQIERDDMIAGVGSWKLESKPFHRRFFKRIEYLYQRWMKKKEKQTHYLRSHCALYRTDLLKKFQLQFSDGDYVAGKAIHETLVGKGFQMHFIPSEILRRYMIHVNHATTILNPELSRKKSVDKELKRVQRMLMVFQQQEDCNT